MYGKPHVPQQIVPPLQTVDVHLAVVVEKLLLGLIEDDDVVEVAHY